METTVVGRSDALGPCLGTPRDLPQGPGQAPRGSAQHDACTWLLLHFGLLFLNFSLSCLCLSTGPPAAPTPQSHPCFRRWPIAPLQCICQPSPEQQNQQDVEGKRFILRSCFLSLSGLTSPKPTEWAVGPETHLNAAFLTLGSCPPVYFANGGSQRSTAREPGSTALKRLRARAWSWSSESQVAVGNGGSSDFLGLGFLFCHLGQIIGYSSQDCSENYSRRCIQSTKGTIQKMVDILGVVFHSCEP